MKQLSLFTLIFSLLFASVTTAQTNVSGGIYANTTWTLAGSPYIVVDTVVVFPGVTLTIDPGVTVKFDNNQSIELRQACLIANGTVTDSIIFTSNSTSPTAGIWNRIWKNGGSMHSSANYCSMKYSTSGFAGIDTIRNSNFSINMSGAWSNYVDSCTFMYNTNIGLISGFANHCTIMHNQVGFETGWIVNSRIDSNQTGVGDTYSNGVRVVNCTINHNQTGSNTFETSSYLNCIIDSNTLTGIKIWSQDSVVNCEIKGNGTGIDGLYNSHSFISRNVIENNNLGITVGPYSGYSIYCNKICNNTTYDLKSLTSNPVNVANNYWCTPDSISTTLRIYDGYDDASLGLVTFMPLDQSNCYLTGCNLNVTATVTNATCGSCTNGSATAHLSNGFPPYSYSWYTTPIQTTQTATGLASGTYTLCVTDGHGCTACNYSIFVDSTNCTGYGISATATNASCSLCSDGSATVTTTAGTPPFNYTWYTSPIQTTQTATLLPTGTYAVCVTDLYGCAACDTVTVGIGNCSAYYTVSSAGPHTYNLTNMASGTPPLTYDWDWGDGSPHDTAAYPTHTYAATSTYTICLTITDSAGCSSNYCHSYYLLTPLSVITVNVIPPITTGVSEAVYEKMITVYPNPVISSITVQSKVPIDNIRIQSVDGREARSLTIGHSASVNIDLQDLSAGIYFIEINKNIRQRFIKQ